MTNKIETTIRRVAHELVARITELAPPVTSADVLEAMRSQTCSAQVLGDAFWLMDNHPNRFANYLTWHPRLRRLRNDPVEGERMFALFCEGETT